MEGSGLGSMSSSTSTPLVSSTAIHKDIEPFDFFPRNSSTSLKFSSFLHSSESPLDSKNHTQSNDDNDDSAVALHIGLPNCANGSMNSSNYGNIDANSAAATKYWIPTPAQILVGFTHFCCHICKKTFNRYNNLQVQILFNVQFIIVEQIMLSL